MEGRVEAYIEEEKLPMGKALKILIQQEKVGREFTIVQQELERKKYSSLKRLIVQGNKYVDAAGNTQELPSNIYTDKETTQNLLIDRKFKHFSLAKETRQGTNGFIYQTLWPHRTSKFSDRVLDGNITEDERDAFPLAEAEELFRATSRPDPEIPLENGQQRHSIELNEK